MTQNTEQCCVTEHCCVILLSAPDCHTGGSKLKVNRLATFDPPSYVRIDEIAGKTEKKMRCF